MNLALLSQKEFAHNSCFLCRAWFCWDQLLSQSQPLSVSEPQFDLCIIKFVNQTRAASGLPLSSLYWLQGSLLFPRASLGLPWASLVLLGASWALLCSVGLWAFGSWVQGPQQPIQVFKQPTQKLQNQ